MKIARIKRPSGEPDFAVAVSSGGWVPLTALGVEATSTRDVIDSAPLIHTALQAPTPGATRHMVSANEASLECPVVAPSKIIAIGLNYMDHIRETNAKAPERPVVFTKFPSSLNAPYGKVVVDPQLTQQADYEVELVVVIGERTWRVSEADALSKVYGYTVANDVSARDWQFADGQWDRSKSFNTFCPVGPWITTADEVPDPNALSLRTLVNGEALQDSTTKEMVFSVSYLIHFLSLGMTLEPGDIILTGTPAGVGFTMEPPRFLQDGDVVECEIEHLGRVRNKVTSHW